MNLNQVSSTLSTSRKERIVACRVESHLLRGDCRVEEIHLLCRDYLVEEIHLLQGDCCVEIIVQRVPAVYVFLSALAR